MPRALAVDAIQPGRSPLSRFEAAERRSREHGSDHTDICRHGDELAASLLLTKLVQPPSSAEAQAAKPCVAERGAEGNGSLGEWGTHSRGVPTRRGEGENRKQENTEGARVSGYRGPDASA